jgi:hypothetical protein
MRDAERQEGDVVSELTDEHMAQAAELYSCPQKLAAALEAHEVTKLSLKQVTEGFYSEVRQRMAAETKLMRIRTAWSAYIAKDEGYGPEEEALRGAIEES